ncbi:MAG TPA: 23S rRNA (guanosine(2251)-2'-O)-methyltransferase RlmB [Thioalkalivibrio sp.]|nr:23S rRNA (guanosine(2251)-2'-O)-methyltransferase RlmB [Thioalkalivibrio sp.]
MSRESRVFGLHAVTAALRNDPENVTRLLVDRGRHDRRLKEVLELAREHGVRVEQVDARQLEREAGSDRHQGVVARYQAPEALGEEALDDILATHPQPLLLVLDSVTDPHNLGACLRTADAAGVAAVIVPRDKAVGLTPTVRKVACGAAESVPFIQVTNLARTLDSLKQQGLWVIGAAGEGAAELYDVDFTGGCVLVMGAEGSGMRRLTREHCDHLVRIPMRGQVESLNVSVATGICLYEALRQRGVASSRSQAAGQP